MILWPTSSKSFIQNLFRRTSLASWRKYNTDAGQTENPPLEESRVWRCCMVLSWGMLLHLNVLLSRRKMSTLATTVEIIVYRVACVRALLVRNILVLVHGQLTALSEERFCKHSLTVHIWLAKSSYCADRTF